MVKNEVFDMRKEVIGVNNKISYKAGAACKKLASFSEESGEEKVIEN